MNNQQMKLNRRYVLHYEPEPSPNPPQPAAQVFIIKEVSEANQQRKFHTFEQVMNFLLDELLDQPEEAPENENLVMAK